MCLLVKRTIISCLYNTMYWSYLDDTCADDDNVDCGKYASCHKCSPLLCL